MTWRDKIPQADALRQYASVVEQILMSGSNMLASIIVLKVSDVAQFGVYSFIFVISTLIVSFFGTLLHRQMMLRIASENDAEQKNIFFTTLVIEAIGLATLVVISIGIFYGLSLWFDFSSYLSLAITGLTFTVFMVMFEACKQYSYTTDNQPYSLRSTVIYIGSQFFFLTIIVWKVPANNVVPAIYAAFSLSLLISLIANKLCQTAIIKSQWRGWSNTVSVFNNYFEQGRFSLIGMSIAWAQNQSINPFLMFVSGPTIAGYFSLARLIIMPMSVINQGLINSSTPTLRRTFKTNGLVPMYRKINVFLIKTLAFSFVYIVALLVGHFTGLFHRYIPEYSHVKWFLLLWVILILSSIYRIWHGQFFVVSIQFKLLLRISIIAFSVTVTGLLIFGLGLNLLYIGLYSVIVGELVAIALYMKYAKQQMSGLGAFGQT